jgi:flagellar biosynthetic protein FliR
MTSAQLTQLINAVTGDRILAFFLVLARLAPLFVLAPVFSAKQIPPVVKGTIGVALSIGLTGVAAEGQRLPNDAVSIIGLIGVQLLVGMAFAFAVGAMFAALEVGGSFLDTVSGFSYGSLINPFTGTQQAVLARLYSLVGLALFLAIGGDAYLLRGIARTFTIVPLASAPHLTSVVGGAVESFTTLFTSALEVAGPVLLALLVTDIGFGLVSRVVPQLNVFAVGMPAKIGIALLLVAATLPFLGGWLVTNLQSAIGLVFQEL